MRIHYSKINAIQISRVNVFVIQVALKEIIIKTLGGKSKRGIFQANLAKWIFTTK
jgi:hypothetical protein